MRRQRRTHQHDDYYSASNIALDFLNSGPDMDDFIRTERVGKHGKHNFENTIEAKVQEGDTLQALALRFHCTVADIKRLNKIDKENEIYARKVIKIPVTVHSVLLAGTLPTVHTSGNNSPKHDSLNLDEETQINSRIERNPLKDASIVLGEKLIVASVNSSGPFDGSSNMNHVMFTSKVPNLKTNTDQDSNILGLSNTTADDIDDAAPLLKDILKDDEINPIRPIRGPALNAIDWSGSDCDMSWVCLFVGILALCFVIPLIYVIYLAENQSHHNTTNH